ncbi:MAG: DUF5675 family protein [Fibromonadales bacterium]|nr:DUF5675 family protein [Fibromonadales bacterium]
MLTLKLTRKEFQADRTFGTLEIYNENGEQLFKCDTLEDKVRDAKVPKITAIPYGYYDMAKTYSPKFMREMWLLLKVPNYEGIRIHAGRKPEHTDGCILVGMREKNELEHGKQVLKNFEDAMDQNYTGLARMEIVKEAGNAN